MNTAADEIRYQAAESADEIAAAIREGREEEALGQVPALARLLAALAGAPGREVEAEPGTDLGDIASEIAAHGTATWLTSRRQPIAIILPAGDPGAS